MLARQPRCHRTAPRRKSSSIDTGSQILKICDSCVFVPTVQHCADTTRAGRTLTLLSSQKSTQMFCGWIHVDGRPLNYPVVKARPDATYYLRHNFSGEESFHGAVTLGRGCEGTIGGRNTVLAAHGMRDWTMFRSIHALCSQEYLDTHATVLLLGSDGTYWRGTWFAAARFHGWSSWPEKTRFESDADFRTWLDWILDQNWLQTDVVPDTESHILTCATCAMTEGEYDRRALFAVAKRHEPPS